MSTTHDAEHTVTGYLSADHDRLDELLVGVDGLVAGGQFEDAGRVLGSFAAGLLRHIRLEDEILFPTFERLTGMTGGPTVVMREEHRAIERHLEAAVAAVGERDAPGYTAAREALLEVLGEHNEKEEAIIYPMTDGHLEEPARRQLAADLRAFR